MKYVLVGVAIFAAQLSTPASADAGQQRSDVSVDIADIDVRTQEGLAEFDRRLVRAVLKACGTAHHLEPEQLRDMDHCRADAHARAMVTRDHVIQRAMNASARVNR